jgi:hypothetical protein
MLSDPTKLLLLAICMVACLGTLFTSPSITMGNAAMRVLAPPVRQHCMAPRQAANKCSKESKAPCPDLDKVVVKCQSVVERAYRHINLGGCPFEIKALTLCEAEWCQSGDGASCERECSNVRESLSSCIQRQVAAFLNRNGIEKDGTLKIQ